MHADMRRTTRQLQPPPSLSPNSEVDTRGANIEEDERVNQKGKHRPKVLEDAALASLVAAVWYDVV
jgi:hypothetical protein